jgi:hypothetical protein
VELWFLSISLEITTIAWSQGWAACVFVDHGVPVPGM